jgi:hypothetical protein
MTDAPWISTVIAVGLVPVAFLFVHAYVSGRKTQGIHKLTGTVAIVWDLSLSVFFYMLYRTIGGEIEGGSLEVEGMLVLYFAVHGVIAVAVIALEIVVLTTGLMQWRRGTKSRWHGLLAPYLLVLWFAAFISGEIVYIVNYIV